VTPSVHPDITGQIDQARGESIDLDLLVETVHRDSLDKGLVRGSLVDIERLVVNRSPLLTAAQRNDVCHRVASRVEGLGVLDTLLADGSVSEIMINGAGPVWVERHGVVEPSEVSVGRSEIDRLIERMVAPIGRRVDRRSPWVDGRLPDGSRFNVVVPPIALDGPYVTIRRFVLRNLGVSEFAGPEVDAFVGEAVAGGANIVVSGGTGAGKTTLLNAIAGKINPRARIVTVEDSAELALPHAHVVRLEARPVSVEGVGLVTIRDLVRNALRMRPDRLIVGEVRGDEALDMIQALNTGHSGCLSTCHANGPLDALRRIESLAMMAGEGMPLEAIRSQLAAAVDLVIQVGRSSDGGRRIVAIGEVVGPDRVELLVDGDSVLAEPKRGRRLVS